MDNFTTLTDIIKNSESEIDAIRKIQKTFKNVGPSSAKIIYNDAFSLAKGEIDDKLFLHNFNERIA